MTSHTNASALLAHLLTHQLLGVLATQGARQPYASLVSFAVSEDLKTLVFCTTRSTLKYRNILSDPKAAMLVDNRSNRAADFHEAAAVTATGSIREPLQQPEGPWAGLYLQKHPHLGEFLASPSSSLLLLEVDTYHLVTRFQRVIEFRVNEWN